MAALYQESFVFDSISILVSVLKMFKYLRLNEQTNMLWAVLTRAGRDIAFFMFTLVMFLSAFIIIGMQLFGSSDSCLPFLLRFLFLVSLSFPFPLSLAFLSLLLCCLLWLPFCLYPFVLSLSSTKVCRYLVKHLHMQL